MLDESKGSPLIEGGCQRGAGTITSSGIRGGEDLMHKATRTLWRLRTHTTTAMPPTNVQICSENRRHFCTAPHNCQLTATPLSTTNYNRILRTAHIHPKQLSWRSPDPRSAAASGQQSP